MKIIINKAIATVGLASNFFGAMPWFGRVTLMGTVLAFLAISVILINKNGGKK